MNDLYPRRKPELPKAEYDRLYNNGWRSGHNMGSLENNKPMAWEDGYLDAATGRDKWHLRDCPDHDACGQG